MRSFFWHAPGRGKKTAGHVFGRRPNPAAARWHLGLSSLHNDAGKVEFTSHPHPKFDPHEWSRVELLVDASKGTAHMAVAQPPGSKAVEVVDFLDPTAGKIGPFAIQIHNKGLFDEYKDIAVEVDPKDDELITVK